MPHMNEVNCASAVRYGYSSANRREGSETEEDKTHRNRKSPASTLKASSEATWAHKILVRYHAGGILLVEKPATKEDCVYPPYPKIE